MTRDKYTDKEISVFNGLITLIKSGCNPYRITVSDIARSANIGKGTIYDYFESKEEAISKAILYYIKNETVEVQKKISLKEAFKEKYFELLYNIKLNYENNLSVYNILLSSGGVGEFYEHLVYIECEMEYFKTIIEEVMKDIIETGIKEGIINKGYNPYYMNMAIRGAISGFSHYISKIEIYKDIGLKEAMNVSYEILTKSLR